MKKSGNLTIMICLISFTVNNGYSSEKDSLNFEKKKIYSMLLDGRINDALSYVKSFEDTNLVQEDLEIKNNILNRFGFDEDKSEFINEKKSRIDDLLIIYRDYWRKSFLSGNEYDDKLISDLFEFLKKHISIDEDTNNNKDQDSLNNYLKEYLKQNGYFTTGFGRTGSYLDFLCWENQDDTVYSFNVHNETLTPKVVRMKNFVSLGWQEYATFKKYYPGGWATKEAIYYVDGAFKEDSENFLVGYLAHEGQHLRDYNYYPKLTGADLEYRAKLTELSMYKDFIYNFINYLITNSNYQSTNAHSIANYCVIRDMSKNIFDTEFENDFEKWKTISVNRLNETAENLFKQNTLALDSIGKEVQNYIK